MAMRLRVVSMRTIAPKIQLDCRSKLLITTLMCERGASPYGSPFPPSITRMRCSAQGLGGVEASHLIFARSGRGGRQARPGMPYLCRTGWLRTAAYDVNH